MELLRTSDALPALAVVGRRGLEFRGSASRVDLSTSAREFLCDKRDDVIPLNFQHLLCYAKAHQDVSPDYQSTNSATPVFSEGADLFILEPFAVG